MNQSRLTMLSLTLLMLLLVLVAAFIFTFQAQNSLETRVTTLEEDTTTLQTEGTRTAAELADASATRTATFTLMATADATNLLLEEELVGASQEISALTGERDDLKTERDDLQSDLDVANDAITQFEERFLTQPPQVTLAAPANGASFAAGEPIEFIVAAGDTIGINRIDFTLNGNTVSYPVANERLLTQPIVHTLTTPGLYTATITVLNVSQLAASITATVQILSEDAAQQAAVATTLTALRDSSPSLPDPIFLVSRAEFDAWLEMALPTEEVARQQTAVLRAFGLLPPNTDLVQWREEALAASFAGLFYEPDADQVFALTEADVTAELAEWLLIQELAPTSPLTATYPTDTAGVTDAALAQQALLLGETVLYQSIYFYRDEQTSVLTDVRRAELSENEAGLISEMPDILREQWLFPYEAGFEFVADVYRTGGFAAVSAAHAAPPLTTWQLMHDSMQLPQEVTLPDLLPALDPGWAVVENGTWGAFRLQQLLALHLADDEVDMAISRWHGDQYVVYARADGQLILAYRLVWATPDDQVLFAAAYTDFATARYGTGGTESGANGRCWTDDETACLFTSETESLVLVAPSEATAVDLAALINP